MARILMWALAIALLSVNTNAQTLAKKPKVLSTREKIQWVNAVKSHKTDDGASVLEVLQFVQRLRPREFKFGNIEAGYNGATGLPDVAGVEYWLGLKRLPGDAIVNLSFDVKKTDAGFDLSHPLIFSLVISMW